MKLVSHYLQSIEGVSIFPIISLIIFMSVFAIGCYWALQLKKEDIQYMSNIPLEDKELIQEEINLLK